MLYGMSFLYGISGSTPVADIAAVLSSGDAPFGAAAVGMLLVLVGFAFKMTLVPFHMWVPDTYQGAPTPVTAYLSVVSKAAGLALLIRIMVSMQDAFVSLALDWRALFVVLSAITMILGTVLFYAALILTFNVIVDVAQSWLDPRLRDEIG